MATRAGGPEVSFWVAVLPMPLYLRNDLDGRIYGGASAPPAKDGTSSRLSPSRSLVDSPSASSSMRPLWITVTCPVRRRETGSKAISPNVGYLEASLARRSPTVSPSSISSSSTRRLPLLPKALVTQGSISSRTRPCFMVLDSALSCFVVLRLEVSQEPLQAQALERLGQRGPGGPAPPHQPVVFILERLPGGHDALALDRSVYRRRAVADGGLFNLRADAVAEVEHSQRVGDPLPHLPGLLVGKVPAGGSGQDLDP